MEELRLALEAWTRSADGYGLVIRRLSACGSNGRSDLVADAVQNVLIRFLRPERGCRIRYCPFMHGAAGLLDDRTGTLFPFSLVVEQEAAMDLWHQRQTLQLPLGFDPVDRRTFGAPDVAATELLDWLAECVARLSRNHRVAFADDLSRRNLLPYPHLVGRVATQAELEAWRTEYVPDTRSHHRYLARTNLRVCLDQRAPEGGVRSYFLS